MKRKEKPKMNSPTDLRLLLPEKMSGRAIARRGRANAAISTLNPKIEIIQAVTVVPILAPMMTLIDSARVSNPAFTKLTTITVVVEDGGNGRLDAVSNALASHFGKPCDIFCYEEHSLKKGSDSSAIAYVGITGEDGKNYFGIGIDHDIIRASIDALESAMNRSLEA